MINITDLIKTYHQEKDDLHALNDISFEIKDNTIFGVIGMSGAGKSTLLRILATLEAPTSGSVLVDNNDIYKLTNKELRKYRSNIGVVFQGYNLLKKENVYNNIAFPLKIQKVDKKEIDKRVHELLKLVHLEEYKDSYPVKLSGGQCQRVAIARALATSPKYLLLDELTSALDPITTRQVITLLKDIQEKTKVTMILITHEMSVVKALADEVIVLNEGRIIEKGLVKVVLTNPKEEITKLLLGKEF